MLTYSQTTGQLRRDGRIIGLGYAGNGPGLSNPAMQNVRMVGPLPQGRYILHRQTGTNLGPVVFSLMPDATNQMFGRSAFYIHWDNQKQDFSASEGCIVLTTTHTFSLLADGDMLQVLA